MDELLALARTTALPPECLAEIGRVVANFALLEHELDILIHGLLKTDRHISRILTSELSFRTLLDASASLVRHIHGEEATRTFSQILHSVSAAEEERNRIVHSLWGAMGPDIAIRTKDSAKRAKGLNSQRPEYSPAELSRVASNVSRAIFRVERFRQSLGYDWVS
jgi:hypothetical protein